MEDGGAGTKPQPAYQYRDGTEERVRKARFPFVQWISRRWVRGRRCWISRIDQALLHPADRVAWLAVLHAPWCGLGLADLHMLAGADDPIWAERCIEDVIAERGDLLSEESYARLMRVWPVLQAAEENRSGIGTAQWVEKTWRSLGGDVYLKPAEMSNARRYLQLLDEVEEQAGTMELVC